MHLSMDTVQLHSNALFSTLIGEKATFTIMRAWYLKKNNWGRRRIYAFRNVVGQDLSQLRTFNVWSSCIIWILSDSHIIIYLNCVNQYIRFFYIWMEPIHDTWSICHSTSHRWTHKLHCGHVLVLDALHTFKWRCTFAYDRNIFSNIMEEWSVGQCNKLCAYNWLVEVKKPWICCKRT